MSDLLSQLRDAVGSPALLSDPADCLVYGYDNSRLQALPLAVVLPSSHQQVEAVIAVAARHRTPVVVRGRGTNTTGATVPSQGGLVLSTERMQRILRIAPEDRLAVVEAGVINGDLQQALRPSGFFWPPDPTSAAYASVGGNLGCNAAGPRAVKYGTPRDCTLGLRVVSGEGRSMRCGVHTTKGVVGYDLTRLLIGSEGTLGIITEATLRLTPMPEAKRTLRALYRDVEAAARAVSAIMAQPVVPCALEFMDGEALRLARGNGAQIADGGALLIIEVDGALRNLPGDVTAVADAARVEGLIELRQAADDAEAIQLWSARKALSPALKRIAPGKINEDVVVPVSRLPELVGSLQELAERHGISVVSFGHAGNGNLHVNLLFEPSDPAQASAARTCLAELFERVLALDGTLSGEHGIGLIKRDFVAREIDPVALQLMQRIKQQMDPLGILNPGKCLPPLAEIAMTPS